MTYRHNCYEPLYKIYLDFIIEKDQEKAKKLIDKIIGEDCQLNFNSQAKTIDYTLENGAQRIIIWLKTPEYSLLAHELIHVIEYVFSTRRMPFTLEGSEFIAYLVEHLFKEFEPIISKAKRKK